MAAHLCRIERSDHVHVSNATTEPACAVQNHVAHGSPCILNLDETVCTHANTFRL